MFWQEKFYTVQCTRVLAKKPEECSGKRNSIQEYWRESQNNVLAREILYKSTGEKARRMYWQEKKFSTGEKSRRMFWQEKFYTRVLARKPEECTGKRKNTRVLARNPEECTGKRKNTRVLARKPEECSGKRNIMTYE